LRRGSAASSVLAADKFLRVAASLKHLLVDGSNVMHAWADTRALGLRDREAARALLIRRVAVVQDVTDWRVTIVFDGRGKEIVVSAVGELTNFAAIYTPAGTTADDIIEQLVAQSDTPSACFVVSGDQGVRETIEAAGGVWCSPGELLHRIEAASEQTSRAVARENHSANTAWRAGTDTKKKSL
jgi:uncharacterized protein